MLLLLSYYVQHLLRKTALISSLEMSIKDYLNNFSSKDKKAAPEVDTALRNTVSFVHRKQEQFSDHMPS
jgi:hypothetical protein